MLSSSECDMVIFSRSSGYSPAGVNLRNVCLWESKYEQRVQNITELLFSIQKINDFSPNLNESDNWMTQKQKICIRIKYIFRGYYLLVSKLKVTFRRKRRIKIRKSIRFWRRIILLLLYGYEFLFIFFTVRENQSAVAAGFVFLYIYIKKWIVTIIIHTRFKIIFHSVLFERYRHKCNDSVVYM